MINNYDSYAIIIAIIMQTVVEEAKITRPSIFQGHGEYAQRMRTTSSQFPSVSSTAEIEVCTFE